MTEIKIWAMMRSGQHPIIDWILEQLPGDIEYINDILHPDCKEFQNKKLCDENKNFLVYNLEDRFIKAGEEEACRLIYNHSFRKNTKRILIIRDPYNMFASRYARETSRVNPITGEFQHPEISKCRWTPLKGWTSTSAIRCWKDHATEAIRPSHVDVVIKFNNWFTSIDYRKEIANTLELDFTDKNINKISQIGEGSSFDGIKHQNNASKMNVLGRYKKYIYDKYFMSLFDEEMKSMTKEIFDWVPEGI